MGVVLFDTQAFVKRLTAAGMPEPQAEVLADEQARLIDERLATKNDLRETKLQLEAKIETVKADLRATELRLEAKIESVKADILKWMFGTIGFQTLALLGAIVALAKALH
jgi:chromatin segregation and condensation protein Rec8/ScpA/Scc1 (kleisin family)